MLLILNHIFLNQVSLPPKKEEATNDTFKGTSFSVLELGSGAALLRRQAHVLFGRTPSLDAWTATYQKPKGKTKLSASMGFA